MIKYIMRYLKMEVIVERVLLEVKKLFANYRGIKNENGETIGVWFVGYDEELIIEEIGEVRKKVISNISLFAVVMIAVMMSIVYMLTKKIKELSNRIEKIGKGDLTGDINIKVSSEFDGMVEGTKEMMSSMKKMIGTIQDSTIQVADNSCVLKDVSEEMYSSSESISASIEEITLAINE